MVPVYKLCYITDRLALGPKPLIPRILEAARADVDLIQIREKDLPARELAALAQAAVDGACESNARIVVNDRLDVALAVGAAGVHLGTQSMPPRVVRDCVNRDFASRDIASRDFLVGVSCHSLDEAVEAEAAGADYLLLGPIFPTVSKLPYGPPLGLPTLMKVTARITIPVLALGGITVERVKPCIRAGAAGIAGISIFQDCDSLAERVRELRRHTST
ncbi:MAG TPA: thiamine phosphate synthase [Terriglobia bacterium]|nr:thiamine phosphate synthase [Terriglobia bacterium]